MSQRSVYRNISPLDHRYYQSNPVLFEKLSGILSEEAAVSYCVQTEVALLKCYIEQQQFGENARERKKLLGMADDLKNSITPEEVYAEEGRTNHFIRAVVNVLYKKGQERGMPEWLLAWIHTGATSADILDTMNSMRMRDVTRTVVLPILIELERELIDLAEEEAETPQIGRDAWAACGADYVWVFYCRICVAAGAVYFGAGSVGAEPAGEAGGGGGVLSRHGDGDCGSG